jgi:hypothetical protein
LLHPLRYHVKSQPACTLLKDVFKTLIKALADKKSGLIASIAISPLF